MNSFSIQLISVGIRKKLCLRGKPQTRENVLDAFQKCGIFLNCAALTDPKLFHEDTTNIYNNLPIRVLMLLYNTPVIFPLEFKLLGIQPLDGDIVNQCALFSIERGRNKRIETHHFSIY